MSDHEGEDDDDGILDDDPAQNAIWYSKANNVLSFASSSLESNTNAGRQYAKRMQEMPADLAANALESTHFTQPGDDKPPSVSKKRPKKAKGYATRCEFRRGLKDACRNPSSSVCSEDACLKRYCDQHAPPERHACDGLEEYMEKKDEEDETIRANYSREQQIEAVCKFEGCSEYYSNSCCSCSKIFCETHIEAHAHSCANVGSSNIHSPKRQGIVDVQTDIIQEVTQSRMYCFKCGYDTHKGVECKTMETDSELYTKRMRQATSHFYKCYEKKDGKVVYGSDFNV